MNDQGISEHKLRYRALVDRRRLGFELERIRSRVEAHPAWHERPLAQRRAIEATLTPNEVRPDADLGRLDGEVRAATLRIVTLAKALRALDTGEPLPEPPGATPAT
ncbi:MAG: hypothetical protein U5J97_12330 [Trueperaceae bacterium]|nr:hypothetical protein [Trueperaceae bacterium]